MEKNKSIGCPVCGSDGAVILLDLNCGNLDNSILYRSLKIASCAGCGHIYNRLSSSEADELARYYNQESGPLNLNSKNKTGDRAGNDNFFTNKRRSELYSLISPHINRDFRVLDVGCATGGFLDYLNKYGLSNLYGIDIIEKYIDYAKQQGNYEVKVGSATAIPFDSKSFDLLVIDQVIEHLLDPVLAFREAKRVLTDGGLLCIGIPDASRYGKLYFFDFFWFLMREHIQHFDIEHLKLLAATEGFELVSCQQTESPIVSEKMIMPNFNALFRLTGRIKKPDATEDCFNLKKEIEQYVSGDSRKLDRKKEIIGGLAASRKPLYVFGIGREFFYLYESAGMKNCNIAALIDGNPYKRENFTVDGRKITDKSVLDKPLAGSVLIITATAHADQIKEELKSNGYPGDILALE